MEIIAGRLVFQQDARHSFDVRWVMRRHGQPWPNVWSSHEFTAAALRREVRNPSAYVTRAISNTDSVALPGPGQAFNASFAQEVPSRQRRQHFPTGSTRHAIRLITFR